MANRMKERYVAEIAPALNKKFGYKSVMQIPKLDKVIVNVRCGESKNNAKELEAIVKDLGIITGQKAVICKARKSVANFKLREGESVGVIFVLRSLFAVPVPHKAAAIQQDYLSGPLHRRSALYSNSAKLRC